MGTLSEMTANEADNAAHVVDVFGIERALGAEQVQGASAGLAANRLTIARILTHGLRFSSLQPSLQFAWRHVHQCVEGLSHLVVGSPCHGALYAQIQRLVQEATIKADAPQPHHLARRRSPVVFESGPA